MKNILNKIEKIVYPIKNGTHVWYKRNRYDIIIDKNRYFIYDWNVIRLLEILIELNKDQEE